MTASNIATASATGAVTRTLGFLLFLFGWTAVLATALGFFGSAWWPLDFVADWRLILLVVLVVAAIGTGLGYSRTSAVIFLGAALVNAVLIAPMWLEQQEPQTTPDRLRVIALDVGSATAADPSILKWVSDSEGDVVLLANAGVAWLGLVEESDRPYRVINEPGLSDGTLVLARDGVRARAIADPPGLDAADVTVIAELGGQDVTILGLSVERPVSAGATEDRLEVFSSVNAGARRLSGSSVIVGNLETARWSNAFEAISVGMVNSEDGFGYLATYPAWDLPLIADYAGLPVDHLLYRGPITVTHRRVSPDLGVDHRALVVDLAPGDIPSDS